MASGLCTLFRNKPVKVLYCGLDAAGKTTLLYKQKLGEIVTTIPTIGFNVESVKQNGVEMMLWDVGTRDKSRVLLRHYSTDMDAAVFVMDSSDRERLEEAVDMLLDFVLPQAEERKVPVLVLANKQDLKDAMSVDEIREAITSRRHILTDLEVFPTTALTLEGVDRAFDWLTSHMALKLAKSTYLPSLSSASFTNLFHYPASFLKGSYLKAAALLASEETAISSDSAVQS